ncbi:germin-like protein subfamily 1 member 14 [Quercus suber]|uniref:Germin-like protein subfamily 1 member 14 n=2 Tax=Fagaceae TaxID=3503 RepID=A0AAW0LYR1_QUESU
MMKAYIVTVALFALAFYLASASDPDPLQDFCVALKDYSDSKSAVFVNGKFCKDPKLVKPEDFFFEGLNIPGNTDNKVGSNVTTVNVDTLPGLNTLGISLVRIDFAPYGENPPHTHPRGTEVLVVLEGTLFVGFVTSNPENRLFTKTLNKGDVFVFPVGLIHFQLNVGKTNALVISGLSSQNPGVITIADAVFGSNPPINPDVLTKAFQLDKNVVEELQKKFGAYIVTVALFALAFSLASASDPDPLQDFCVALKDYSDYSKSAVFVNGKFCKDPKLVKPEDFFFEGLNVAGNTDNKVGSNVTTVNVDTLPGLNTLGISLARIDFAPYGENPPHTHPRGTEILVVLEGTLFVGFVTSNPDNRLFTKTLNKGDVFVFPVGLIHFQFNVGKTNAIAISGLSSQNAGVITIADAVFGSNPPINPNVLTKAFQLDKNVVEELQKEFGIEK